MGDKTAARRAAIACDVPIVPGTNQALQNVEEAKEFADKVGVCGGRGSRGGGHPAAQQQQQQ
jgi:acetyl/propionyl-CoA carboxylase alpha subunit